MFVWNVYCGSWGKYKVVVEKIQNIFVICHIFAIICNLSHIRQVPLLKLLLKNCQNIISNLSHICRAPHVPFRMVCFCSITTTNYKCVIRLLRLLVTFNVSVAINVIMVPNLSWWGSLNHSNHNNHNTRHVKTIYRNGFLRTEVLHTQSA